jgi:hypothetical protein
MIANTLVWRTRVVSPDLLVEAQAGAKAPVSLRVLVEDVLEFQNIVKTVMRLLIVKLVSWSLLTLLSAMVKCNV